MSTDKDITEMNFPELLKHLRTLEIAERESYSLWIESYKTLNREKLDEIKMIREYVAALGGFAL